MPTHVALLRAVNVGGRNRLTMSDLRQLTVALGHLDVATYVQSGNLLFTPRPGRARRAPADELARELQAAIEARTEVVCGVVVLDRDELAMIVAGNPFVADADPKHLHAVLRDRDLSIEDLDRVSAALERAREKGSPDDLAVVGRTLYLHTPQGLGRSELSAQLSRLPIVSTGTSTGQGVATTRNWTTVSRLLQMLDE